MTDTKCAVAWLRAWAPDGPWTVAQIDPEEGNRVIAATFTGHQVEEMTAHIEERNGKLNLYFVPNPHNPYRHPAGYHTTPRKQDIKAAIAIMVDLDLPEGFEQSQHNIEKLLHRIHSLDPPATATVYSGGGLQAYWVLSEPLPATVTVDDQGKVDLGPAERAERVGKTVSEALRSDAIQNINRLMRLPGTVNLPNAKKRARGRQPALASIVDVDWSRRWSFASDPVPHLPPDYWLGDEVLPKGRDPRKTVTHAHNDLPERWRKLIKIGDASDYNGDRSALVFALTCVLVRRGWPDDEIVALLTNAEHAISAHVREQSNPVHYARRQAERARAAIAADWDRDPKTGGILGNSPANIRRALAEIGYQFRYNVFRDRMSVNGVVPNEAPLENYHFSEIRVSVHDRFKFLANKDVLTDTVNVVARAAAYDPVLDYFASAASHYDGIPRIGDSSHRGWLTRYFGIEDSSYTRAVGRLMLVATVRRARRPGCQFDEMLVLMSSEQGLGKSSGIKALVPDEEWYSASVPLRANEQQVVELLRGKLIIEFSEMTGVQHTEVEHLKSFLSRTVDEARPAYGRIREEVRRRCTFWGTTNSDAFLRDRRNRRFWPQRIPDNTEVDVAGIVRDRDMLWAEAALAEATGEPIRLDRSLWIEAADHQEEFRYGDAWTDVLIGHLVDHPDLGELQGIISSRNVWRLLGKPGHARGPVDNGRLTECMRELGWERRMARVGVARVPTRSFVKGDASRTVYVINDVITNQLVVTYAPASYERDDGYEYDDDRERPPF